MYAIRTLLSYSLVIIIVAAVVLAFYYRDQLMPEVDAIYEDVESWVNDRQPASTTIAETQTAETAVENVQPEVETTETPMEQGETVVESTETVVSGPGEAAVEAPGEMTTGARMEPEVETTDLAEIPSEVATEAPASPEQQAGVTTPPPAATASSDMMAAASLPGPTSDSQSQQVIDQPGVGDKTDVQDKGRLEHELIRQARQAFWNRQYGEAEAAYKDLIEISPENPDLYGELGNLYYSMGKWELAGTAYYAASTRLLKSGQTGQLGYLVRVLKGLDPDLAEKLEQDMKQTN
ncbi:MAG: hypothetical protein LJE73_02205 [Proteobacteria bacterium]|jgi:TolA-binding protein|nr:hypothetical protein [Pseudomonadota bacterium]